MRLIRPMSGPSDIVDRLGGPDVVARRFGISLKAIDMWGQRGGVPGRWHIPMLMMADELGVPLSMHELSTGIPERPEPAEARP